MGYAGRLTTTSVVPTPRYDISPRLTVNEEIPPPPLPPLSGVLPTGRPDVMNDTE